MSEAISGIIKAGNLELSTKLYRYVSLSTFLHFAETKRTYLTKIKQWDDKWEAPFCSLPHINDKDGKLEYPLWTIADGMYGQCWSTNGESDAMWRIYSPNRDGLLLQTSVGKFDLLTGVTFGLLAPVVYYSSLSDGIDLINATPEYRNTPFRDGFLKRQAFEHEKEVRLITLDDDRCISIPIPRGSTHVELPLNPSEFLEGLILDPRSADWQLEALQSYCKRIGLGFLPMKSTLYSSGVHEATGLAIQGKPVRSDTE